MLEMGKTLKFLRTFLNLLTIEQFLMFSIASFMIIWNFIRSEIVLNFSWVIGFILTFIYDRKIQFSK